jgi:hypothetical protein
VGGVKINIPHALIDIIEVGGRKILGGFLLVGIVVGV